MHAGATFKIDDTKWLSIGAGLKTSFAAVDDQAGVDGDKWDTDFFLNNIRLYLNGQLHEYIKLTFNTDCHNCSDGGSVRVLDAIARFGFNDYVNIWFGRTLVPAERTELNGPFYNPLFDTFEKSPFEPADFGLQGNTTFPQDDDTPGGSAGQFGRNDGVVLWGPLIEQAAQVRDRGLQRSRRSRQPGQRAPVTPCASPITSGTSRTTRVITPAALLR